MPKEGLFYPDGTFADRKQIRRKLLAEELMGKTEVKQLTDFPKTREFEAWTEIVIRQQSERRELFGIPEHIEVEIKADKPFLVSLLADSHFGGADIDYERYCEDVNLTHEASGYSITVGDLTDSFFFMPEVGEQIISGDEQVLFAQAALERLAEGGRLIAGFGGDHDMWSKDKGGAHTLYHQFHQKYNAHYLEGVSYITLNIDRGDKTIPIGFVGSHRHKGFSVYNDAHSSLRQWRDEGVGAVVSFTAHNHIKAMLAQVHKLHGGGEFLFHSLALGSYKMTDRYSRKMGWPRKGKESMGAFGLVVDPQTESVTPYWTVEQAIDHLR